MRPVLLASFLALAACTSGTVGPQGPQGPAGPAGPTGPTGPQGDAGIEGPRGINWVGTWDAGASYAVLDSVQFSGSSFIAVASNSGEAPQLDGGSWQLLAAGGTGPQGPQGDVGPIGLPGVKGDTGTKGDTGDTGPQGAKGDTGAAGPQGPTGALGPQGPQGPAGAAGPQGAKGDTGAIGPQGPAGPTGAQGPAGATGAQGATGATGPQGPAGPTGPQGATGASGFASLFDSTGTPQNLGKIVALSDDEVTVLTSTGYLVTYRWDGTLAPHQVLFSSGTCTGTAALNTKGSTARSLTTKRVIWAQNQLFVPSSATSTSFTAASFDSNGSCKGQTFTASAWALSTTTKAIVGVPTTIVAPLVVQ